MFTANVQTKLYNPSAVSFKNNSSAVILPADQKAVDSYVRRNWEVAGEGFADGNLSFPKFLARRVMAFIKLLSPSDTNTILTNAKLIEQELKDQARNNQVIGGRLDVKAA